MRNMGGHGRSHASGSTDVPVSRDHHVQAQEVHAELEKHMAYFRAQGKKKMGNEIMHLQLKPAYKQHRINLEAMIVPNTPNC